MAVANPTQQNSKNYRFFLTSDVNVSVKIKLLHVEGDLSKLLIPDKSRPNTNSLREPDAADFYITVQLYAGGKPLLPPATSAFGSLSTTTQYTWNQTLSFPIKYQALPLSTQLVFTIWDISEPSLKVPAGGTAIRLFGSNRTLRKGRQKLYIWEGREGDGASVSATQGKQSSTSEIDRIEKLVKKYARHQIEHVEWLDRMAFRAIEQINGQTDHETLHKLALFIELPDFGLPVIFHEKISNKTMSESKGNEVVVFYDPEVPKKNPIELKHLNLSRARRPVGSIAGDINQKPNSEEREELKRLIASPPTRVLTLDEKEKLWKFRYFLRDNKKALIKFLKSVEWTHAAESEAALQLLDQWEPMDLDDALELLGTQFSHAPRLRHYAVRRLETYSDDDLQYYLLQLVQSLRYDKSPLADLASFLIRRGAANPVIGNYLYWYLKVECADPMGNDLFQRVLKEFLQALSRLAKDQVAASFKAQEEVIEQWTSMCTWIKRSPLPRPKKIDKVREMIREGGEFGNLAAFPKLLPFPLDPSLKFGGVKNDVYIFKSAMEPLKLTIDTTPKVPMTVRLLRRFWTQIIFKMGDDLRQDQLMVQMISLMDRLLKKENLDLKLSPYKVLATSRDVGMLECVSNSRNISEVLKESGGDIKKYMKNNHPDPAADFGIKPQVLNNFVRSCAGYCVITYILGIGDRHLDNLLLTHDGRLFHIDFGFILGRDPKPFPPPMKLCQEMVEGMGGKDSKYYSEFKAYCCEAFNILRKSANLILNLFALMIDAGIQDIDQGDKSVVKVQEKLRLDLTDEEANGYFQLLINESVRALFPQIAETVHRWANYWRS